LIRDNEVGFDITYADKLFSLFHRLHKASEFARTDIDLAIVQRIIRRHKVEVRPENKQGRRGRHISLYTELRKWRNLCKARKYLW
jgi:light-regulated signal transduction histidine kinase (bacteriophytochrome)